MWGVRLLVLCLVSTVSTVTTASLGEKATAPIDEQGQCCYLCEPDNKSGPGSCYGCWSLNSVCNDPTSCKTCGGYWHMGGPPPLVPPAAPQSPLLNIPLVNWNKTYDGLPGPPVFKDSVIYLVNGDLAINNETVTWIEKLDINGNNIWNRTYLTNNLPVTDSWVHFTLPAVSADGNVYVQVDNLIYGPSLYTLDADTGQLKWNISLPERYLPTGVAAGGGGVFYMNVNGTLTKSDAETGVPMRWFDSGVGGQFTPPIVSGNHVFKSGKDSSRTEGEGNYVYALTVDLEKSWPVQCRVAPWLVRVAANDDLVLVSTTYFDEYNPLPVGQPDGMITAFTPSGFEKWTQRLNIAASVGQPALATVEGEAPIAVFTACDTPPIEGMPPVWWVGCTVWAIDTRVAGTDIHDSVLWRYTPEHNVVLSAPVVGGGAVFIGGANFANGTWPYCVWPPTEPLPNCTFSENSTFPGYEDPFLIALRVSDGRLLWKTPVSHGRVTAGSIEDVVRAAEDYEVLKDVDLAHGSFDEVRRNFVAAELTRHMMGLPNILVSIVSFIPWSAFDVNAEGTVLVYTGATGVVSLDVSARGEETGSSSSNWMAPVAAASCGVATIIIVAVAANRMCEGGEDDFLVKGGRGSPAGSGYDSIKSYSDARSPEEDYGYEIIRQLGRGGFGHVFLVKKKSNGHLYSLKRIDCRCDRELKIAKREVSILSGLPKHPGLIKIIETFNADDAVFMVLPYYEQGDLANFIQTYPEPVIPEATVVSFGRQVADVLMHLHNQSPPVVHRDLKPENILMTSDRQRVVVADFGLSRMVDKTYMHTHAGTMAFMAPESFDGPYDTKIDLWSLGCVIYSLCLKRSRNCRVMCVHVGRRGFHQEIADSISARGYSPLVVDLVRQTLQANRHARPSAEEVLFRLGADAPPPLRLGASHSSLSHSASDDGHLHAPLAQQPSLNESNESNSGASSVPAPSVHAPSIQGGSKPPATLGAAFYPSPNPVPPTNTNIVPPGLLRGIVRSTPDPQSDAMSISSGESGLWCPPSPPPVEE